MWSSLLLTDLGESLLALRVPGTAGCLFRLLKETVGLVQDITGCVQHNGLHRRVGCLGCDSPSSLGQCPQPPCHVPSSNTWGGKRLPQLRVPAGSLAPSLRFPSLALPTYPHNSHCPGRLLLAAGRWQHLRPWCWCPGPGHISPSRSNRWIQGLGWEDQGERNWRSG